MDIRKDRNSILVARSALSMAVSLLSLLIFRGPVSIFSAFLIPAIIVVFAGSFGLPYYILTTGGLLLTTFLFFPTQILFVVGYALLALFLKLIFLKGERLRTNFPRVLVYAATASLAVFIGIYLTELIFMVPLHSMMIRLSGGSPLIYGFIIGAEGGLIAISNLLLLKVFVSRLKEFIR